MDVIGNSEIRNYKKSMKYRALGLNGPKVSILGFGGARLTPSNESEEAIAAAIKSGINIFETGPGYGNSESIIGSAIQGQRDKVFLSTKCSIIDEYNKLISQDDLLRSVEVSLRMLDVDKIDIFNAWNIKNIEHFEAARKKGGFIECIRKLMEEGVVDYFGFSSHDSPANIRKYIDSGEFDSAILSYSIVDRTYEDVICYANEKRVGVIAMKPLYGGVAISLSDIFKNLNDDDLVILSLKLVLSLTSISSAISGMANAQQVWNNIMSVEGIEVLGTAFRDDLFEKYRNYYTSDMKCCSGCRYCDSCPVGIPIPKLMKFYNVVAILKKDNQKIRHFSKDQTVKISDIEGCLECKLCQRKCPENIQIVDRLKELRSMLED